MRHLVSTIVYSYNNDGTIEKTIQSVCNQDYDLLELVIIDDCSCDSSQDKISQSIIACENKFRIKYIKNKIKLGVSKSLNICIDLASGEFVQFIFGGDLFLESKTSKCAKVFSNLSDGYAAVYSDGYLIDNMLRRRGLHSEVFRPPIGKMINKELMISCWIARSSIMFRRNVFDSIGRFDEEFNCGFHDYLFRLSATYKIEFIKDRLFLNTQSFVEGRVLLKKDESDIKHFCDKHTFIGSFNCFNNSLIQGDVYGVFRKLSYLNMQLYCLYIIRQIQEAKLTHGHSYVSTMLALWLLLFKRYVAKVRMFTLFLKGFPVGKNNLFRGSLKFIGSAKNIKIGKNVIFEDNITIKVSRAAGSSFLEILDNAVIQENVMLDCFAGSLLIGAHCSVGRNSIIQANGNVQIGDYTMVAPNVGIYANNHVTNDKEFPYIKQGYHFKGIEVGRNCWIAHGAVIVDGTTIGNNCIVGPNVVVRGILKDGSRLIN